VVACERGDAPEKVARCPVSQRGHQKRTCCLTPAAGTPVLGRKPSIELAAAEDGLDRSRVFGVLLADVFDLLSDAVHLDELHIVLVLGHGAKGSTLSAG
jgi:hypothetical protein